MIQWLKNWFQPRALDKSTMPGWYPYPTSNLSGVEVNSDTVLTISAAWRCISLISGTVGTMPMDLYRMTSTGAEEITDHPVARLLAKPNPIQGRTQFRESLMASCLALGNAYAEVQRLPD